MSIQILENELIDRIVYGLINRIDGSFYCKRFAEKLNDNSELGKMVLSINVKAYNFKYNETSQIPPYQYTDKPVSLVKSISACASFLYNSEIDGIEYTDEEKRFLNSFRECLLDMSLIHASRDKEYYG